MKIAFVCGHYIPEMGYMEVHFAREFSKMGHRVQVFTSSVVPAYVKQIAQTDYSPGVTMESGVTINRLKHSWSLGQMIKPKGLVSAVKSFSPNLIICMGVGKLWPKRIYSSFPNVEIFTFLGDNAESHKEQKSLLYKFKYKLKKSVYQYAVKRSDKLVMYTPETADIVKRIVGQEKLIDEKTIPFSLGFEEEKFFFSPSDREKLRQELGFSKDDKVIITATRINPSKNIEQVVDYVDELNEEGVSVKYVIIGFQEDEYAQQLKQTIGAKSNSDQFISLPFIDSNKLNAYYSMADIAYFPSAAISIFEAIGTGLMMVLPDHKSLPHILDDTSGWYSSKENLKTTLKTAIQFSSDNESRKERSKKQVKRFSYRELANRLLQESLNSKDQ